MKPPYRARVPKGRALTVANLIKRMVAETGREPSDTELAAMLATSAAHIARVRAKLNADSA